MVTNFDKEFTMKIVTLNTDAKMPIIGLGTFLSSTGDVYRAVRWALKVGYRHIDCASIYGNQNEVGQAIQDAMNEDNIKNRRHIMIQRWIDDSGLGEWPKAYHINYKFLTQINQQ